MASPIIWGAGGALNLTPKLTLPGSTSGLLTLQPAAVTTSYTLTMPAAQGGADSFVSNNSGTIVFLTPTQATSKLDNFVGDSGSGGTKGLVPAPASGDAAAGKFLKADGSWTTPPGSPTFSSEIVADTANNYGAVDTKIRRFTNVATTGTDMTATNNANNGLFITINTAGVYAVVYQDYNTTTTCQMGLSKNSNQLTTDIYSINKDHRIAAIGTGPSYTATLTWVGWCAVNDVIRPHNGVTLPDSGTDRDLFRIQRIL